MIYEGAEAQIPHLSGGQIEQEAGTFLKENWDDGFPVDVETICDKIGIGIIFIPGIYKSFGVESYINSGFDTIVIDEDIANNNENRFRFSIAHELGHMVLHKEYYPSDISDLESFLRYISNERGTDAEWQANLFAAALLVPLRGLDVEMEKKFGRDLSKGISTASEDAKRKFYTEITKHFQVSDKVLAKRIQELLK